MFFQNYDVKCTAAFFRFTVYLQLPQSIFYVVFYVHTVVFVLDKGYSHRSSVVCLWVFLLGTIVRPAKMAELIRFGYGLLGVQRRKHGAGSPMGRVTLWTTCTDIYLSNELFAPTDRQD